MADENKPHLTDTNPTFGADPLGAAASPGEGAPVASAPTEEAPKASTTERLREEAGKLGSQAAERARSYADEGKERATTALDEVARMMKNAAEDVDAKLGVEYGRYARSAADGVSSFAESLRGKEVDDLIAGATDFVRKSPVMAVGAAAAVGFVVARLVKSGLDAGSETGARTSGPDTTDV